MRRHGEHKAVVLPNGRDVSSAEDSGWHWREPRCAIRAGTVVASDNVVGVYIIEDGQIADDWDLYDHTGLLEQLGGGAEN